MTNESKFVAVTERIEAFRKYCEKMHDRPGGSCGKQERCSVCSLKWLDLEAEEESFEDVIEEVRKRMIDREHSPSLWPFIDRLEAAHNRVSKKCMEVKE